MCSLSRTHTNSQNKADVSFPICFSPKYLKGNQEYDKNYLYREEELYKN